MVPFWTVGILCIALGACSAAKAESRAKGQLSQLLAGQSPRCVSRLSPDGQDDMELSALWHAFKAAVMSDRDTGLFALINTHGGAQPSVLPFVERAMSLAYSEGRVLALKLLIQGFHYGAPFDLAPAAAMLMQAAAEDGRIEVFEILHDFIAYRCGGALALRSVMRSLSGALMNGHTSIAAYIIKDLSLALMADAANIVLSHMAGGTNDAISTGLSLILTTAQRFRDDRPLQQTLLHHLVQLHAAKRADAVALLLRVLGTQYFVDAIGPSLLGRRALESIFLKIGDRANK